MKNPILLLLVLFTFYNCSHYVTISYRSPSESPHQLPKNSKIALTFSKKIHLDKVDQEEFKKIFNHALVEDSWLILDEDTKKASKNKSSNTIHVLELNFSTIEGPSSQWENDDKTVHSTLFDGTGKMKVELKTSQLKLATEIDIEVIAKASSEINLPPAPGRKSLRPYVNALLGIDDERTKAINSQKALLSNQVLDELNKKLAFELLKNLAPEKKYVEVKLMDSENDMNPYIKFLARSEYSLALQYLVELNQPQRIDILYNQAIALEMQNRHNEACPLYQAAYDLEKDAEILELKIGCENRRDMTESVGKI